MKRKPKHDYSHLADFRPQVQFDTNGLPTERIDPTIEVSRNEGETVIDIDNGQDHDVITLTDDQLRAIVSFAHDCYWKELKSGMKPWRLF